MRPLRVIPISLLFCVLFTLIQENSTFTAALKRKPVEYPIYLLSPRFGNELLGNFFEAFQYCTSIGMRVASPRSLEEFDKLAQFMHKENLSQIWTDGNDLAKEGVFNWLGEGVHMQYGEWEAGQPDNADGSEHCVAVRHNRSLLQCFMNDDKCLQQMVVVCEIKPVSGKIRRKLCPYVPDFKRRSRPCNKPKAVTKGKRKRL